MNRYLFLFAAFTLGMTSTAVAERPMPGEHDISAVRCRSQADCLPGTFCLFREGTCGKDGAEGGCTKRAEACTMNYDPVCGCDGNTYSNACAAATKGQSVERKGNCDEAAPSEVAPNEVTPSEVTEN